MLWIETTGDYDRETGGERWVKLLDGDNWISVLYRLTGFGWYEWETALCLKPEVRPKDWPDWKRYDCLIIGGDRREELGSMPLNELRDWYLQNIDGNRNSMGTLLEAIRPSP